MSNRQIRQAICEMFTANVPRNLLVNRDVPPFDNPDLPRAMSLSLDRKTFIDILTEGQGDIGGVMQPPPSGLAFDNRQMGLCRLGTKSSQTLPWREMDFEPSVPRQNKT